MTAYLNGVFVDGDPVAGPFLNGADLNGFKAELLAAAGTDASARTAAQTAANTANTAQALAAAAIPASQKGQANGVAALDGTGKVPLLQLPPAGTTTDQVARDAAASAQITANAAIPGVQKGAINGVASLDGTGKVLIAQLPPAGTTTDQVARDAAAAAQTTASAAIPADQKGALNGVAPLVGGLLPASRVPVANATTVGGIRIGFGLAIDGSGVVSASGAATYTLPAATNTTLGGIKIGSGLAIDGSGVVTAAGGSGGAPYTLPAATPTTLGGVLARTQQRITVASTTMVVAATDSAFRIEASATGACTGTMPSNPVGSILLSNRRTGINTADRMVHFNLAAGHTVEGNPEGLNLDTGDALLVLNGTDWTAT